MSEILNMAPASLFLFSQSEKLFLTTNLSLCLPDSLSFGQKPSLIVWNIESSEEKILWVVKMVNYSES